jgi:hypothetical protein
MSVELANEFIVDLGVDETWALLTDIERIAPCMPGAELTSTEGDDYLGTVKVNPLAKRIGPVLAVLAAIVALRRARRSRV